MAEPHTTGATQEYDVLLSLSPKRDISDDALATIAESILEAVETYAASCVEGAAIGYTLKPQEIRLDFTTEAESVEDVQRTIERVNEIIVGETRLTFETRHSETVTR